MVCTFFGHREICSEVEPVLRAVLTELIENKKVDLFYVGNNGCFDAIVLKTIKLLKNIYPHINYNVVLAYMPKNKKTTIEELDTIYPFELEKTPPKYAIVKRNIWMIQRSDYVVTYVKYTFGGAARFKELAQKKGKIVLELATLSGDNC